MQSKAYSRQLQMLPTESSCFCVYFLSLSCVCVCVLVSQAYRTCTLYVWILSFVLSSWQLSMLLSLAVHLSVNRYCLWLLYGFEQNKMNEWVFPVGLSQNGQPMQPFARSDKFWAGHRLTNVPIVQSRRYNLVHDKLFRLFDIAADSLPDATRLLLRRVWSESSTLNFAQRANIPELFIW